MSKHTPTDIFARFLVKQLTYNIAKREGMVDRLTQGEVKTPPAWKELDQEYNEIIEELKRRGRYFHEGGGSVFMDFKNLRDSIVPEGGMDEIAGRFSSNMNKDDLLKSAREVVEEWQSGSGRERKK